MVVLTARRTEAFSPRLLSTGCCGSSTATPRLAHTLARELLLLLAGAMLSVRTLMASLCRLVALVLLLVAVLGMRRPQYGVLQ